MECLTNLATEAVSKLGDLVAESTVKQFKYLIHHKKITANLKEEHNKLKAMKQGLQGWADAERRKGYEIAPDVQKWLSDVEATEKELEKFYENEVNKSKKCFGGRCPDLAFNYSLGKRATKSTECITTLQGERSKFQQHISFPKAPSRIGSTFTDDIKSMESRNKIISEFIEKLKDDKLKRISICGMGGVGKTTLVKELIKIVENSKLFDVVVMAVVSQNPNYEKIQSEIAADLGLEFKTESDSKASQLLQRLKGEDKVLIVLDDVWEELNFEEIGLPPRDHQKKTKILFTSRNEKVCRNMGSQENFQVSVSSEEEAWELFQDMAGDVVDKPDIYPIAKQVANECGGLPLAIVTVGRALENEDKLKWEVALEQLRNSQSSSFLLDMQKFVYSRIELSVSFLGSEEHKFLLMLCSLFPEDFDIPIESLLRHGIGWGLFESIDALWKARNRVHAMVGNLKRCFLLLDSYEPECVRIHDVVRDVILSVASRAEHRIMVKYSHQLKWLKEDTLSHINAISLIMDEMEELENGLQCPTLQLLQVRSQSKKPYLWPEHFFQGMGMLKVLALQDLCIPKIPSLFQASVNLHTLQVEGCDVGDISVIGKELKKLEILGFAYSNIKELPTEIGQLSFLRLLDLTRCDDLNFISTNVFARLSRLEELYFRVANFPWRLNEAVFKELKGLSQQLKVLDINVRKQVEILPNDLIFKNLEKFWVYVVPYINPKHHGYLESNRLEFQSTDYNSIKSRSSIIMPLVKKCENLILKKVKNLKNIIYEIDDSGLQSLKDLLLDSCPNLEYIVDCSTPYSVFPLIKSLSLNNLNKLKEIFNVSDRRQVKKSLPQFSYLEKLVLNGLPNLIGFGETSDLNEPHQSIHYRFSNAIELADSTIVKDDEVLSRSHSLINAKLFSSNWMKQFQKLETILLQKCISLEMVFDLQGYSESNIQLQHLLFPQLKEIEISNLSRLTYVWCNVPRYVQGFQKLSSMTISNCDSLRHIFTIAIVRAMMNLEKLEVSSCKLMESLVGWGIEKEKDNDKDKAQVTTMFPQLKEINISNLASLTYMWGNVQHYVEGFQKLSSIIISNCDSLRHIFTIAIVRAMVNLEKLEVSSCKLMESLVGWGIEKEKDNDKDKAQVMTTMFPQLKEIKISNLDSLTYMWGNVQHYVEGFQKLSSMTISNSDSLRHIFTIAIVRAMVNLEKLEVSSCKLMESLVGWGIEKEKDNDKDKAQVTTMFPQLKEIKISNLASLTYMWGNVQHYVEGFQKLSSIIISNCDSLRHIFTIAIVRAMVNLEKLEVSSCKLMESLVGWGIEKGKDNDKDKAQVMTTMFPQLKEIKISNLDSLTYMWGNVQHYVEGFQKLSSMTISNSDSLRHIFTIAIVRAMVNLEKLEVSSCKLMESLVGWGIEKEKDNDKDKAQVTTMFPQLKEIKISNLASLTYMWGNVQHYVEGFQNLSSIIISNCDSLRHIFTIAIVRAMVNLEKLEVSSCKLMENLVWWGIEKEMDKYKDKTQVTTIVFSKLYSISLSTLPKFVSTSSDLLELEFPSLREFKIDDCPMLEISILPNHMLAKGDNLNFTCYANIKDGGFSNFKENNSRCFNLPIGLIPLVPKIIRKGSTNKTSSKEVSLAQDHVPSNSEMKSTIDKAHMPILEDLYVRKCDLLDIFARGKRQFDKPEKHHN